MREKGTREKNYIKGKTGAKATKTNEALERVKRIGLDGGEDRYEKRKREIPALAAVKELAPVSDKALLDVAPTEEEGGTSRTSQFPIPSQAEGSPSVVYAMIL